MTNEQKLQEAQRVLEFIASWAWRTDPLNASNKLTVEERFDAIKHHPTIYLLGAPHRELADKEASKS